MIAALSSRKTPDRLFVNQARVLLSHLPGVRDGRASSIHDSRVATRRIRQLLQLAAGLANQQTEETGERFAKAGKALGAVRDADVRIQLLSGLEARNPHLAPWLVRVRYAQERARQGLVRRLIKRLEQLEIARIVEEASSRHSPFRKALENASRTARWRNVLDMMMAARAHKTIEAIEHAGGVYFPNRLHRARIAVKKLRYALEIPRELGAPDLDASLRGLKKAQEVLGDLHDRQALLDEFQPMAPTPKNGELTATVRLVTEVVEAECRALHERYVARRAALVDIARKADSFRVNRPSGPSSLVAVGATALALSAAAFVGLRGHELKEPPEVASAGQRPRALVKA